MSDFVQPHRQQPTRLPYPWDSPGKNNEVGCHFLLQCVKVKNESEVTQSCLTHSNPMDCSLPGSSVHGIFGQEYWSGVPLPSPICSYDCINQIASHSFRNWRLLIQRVSLWLLDSGILLRQTAQIATENQGILRVIGALSIITPRQTRNTLGISSRDNLHCSWKQVSYFHPVSTVSYTSHHFSLMFLEMKVKVWVTQSCPFSVTPQTLAQQAPLSMEFSKEEYWSGLPFPFLGDRPYPGI